MEEICMTCRHFLKEGRESKSPSSYIIRSNGCKRDMAGNQSPSYTCDCWIYILTKTEQIANKSW